MLIHVVYLHLCPYYFQLTPAVSREGNKDCILMGFYDAHDVWHFLSAISLFFSFLVSFSSFHSLNLCMLGNFKCFLPSAAKLLFSSPEPLAQGELLCSLDVCCRLCVVRCQQLLQMSSPPKLLAGF